MSAGSTGAAAYPLKIHDFLYPEAPWEVDSGASKSIFRELSLEETGATGSAASESPEAGLASSTNLSSPVRYEYRLEPGFEMELEEISEGASQHLSDAQRDGAAAPEIETEDDRRFRELLASECAKAEERGRADGLELGYGQGRQEGREEAIRQLHAGVEGERNRLAEQTAALIKSFAGAREGYLQRLETESARLALAIAARILRREAQADPLLLTGAVRVALGQLSAGTAVRLRVPAIDLALWSEALAHLPNLAIRPEVIGDPQLKPGECSAETELGTANLDLDAQLHVLERRLFDREGAEAARTDPDLWESVKEVSGHDH